MTFSELHVFDATFWSICVALLSVIPSSSDVNHPEFFGHVVTSSCSSDGRCCCGTRNSFGIASARAVHFAAATFCHFASDVMIGRVVQWQKWQYQQARTLQLIGQTSEPPRASRSRQSVSIRRRHALSSDEHSPPLSFGPCSPRFLSMAGHDLYQAAYQHPRTLGHYRHLHTQLDLQGNILSG
jgi:hypothetical protein